MYSNIACSTTPKNLQTDTVKTVYVVISKRLYESMVLVKLYDDTTYNQASYIKYAYDMTIFYVHI